MAIRDTKTHALALSQANNDLTVWMSRVDQEIELAMSFPVTWGVFFKPERDPGMNTEQYYEVLQDQVLEFFCNCLSVEENKDAIQDVINKFEYR